MKVYTTDTGRAWKVKFHRTPNCKSLRAGRGGSKNLRPILEVDLEDLERPEPCLTCFPGAPRAPQVWRPNCPQCYGALLRPCKHNGGVLVESIHHGGWPGKVGVGDYDPEAIVVHRKYVWPENAHHFRLVEE